MLERQIQALGTVMKSPEFHSRALDGALSLMKLVLFKDMLIDLTQQTTISCNRPLYGTTTVR